MNARYERMLWSDLTGLRFNQVGTDVLILGRGGKTYLATTLLPQNRRCHLSAHTLDRIPMLRRCHRAAHSTVPMTSVLRFDQLAEGIAVRRSLGGSAPPPLAIQPEAASSAASPRFTMSPVLNRMPSAVSRDFGVRRSRNSSFMLKCLNSSPIESSVMARASTSGSTELRCTYEPIASASSLSDAHIRAKVRVSADSSSGGSDSGRAIVVNFLANKLLLVTSRPSRNRRDLPVWRTCRVRSNTLRSLV